MYHVAALIEQVRYDSEQLRIDRVEPGFENDMDIFVSKADLLKERATETLRKSIENPSYRRDFT